MIALDTNVLVRFVVEDDAAQHRRSSALIASARERGEALFLSQLVLCELVWVLGAAYGLSRAQIASALTELLRVAQVVVEDFDQVRRALDAYMGGEGDFADYLIRERARAAGCETVKTFDRVLLHEPGFSAPDDEGTDGDVPK